MTSIGIDESIAEIEKGNHIYEHNKFKYMLARKDTGKVEYVPNLENKANVQFRTCVEIDDYLITHNKWSIFFI